MKISFFFAWYDGWFGYFYDRKNHILYLCPFPWCVFKVVFNHFVPEVVRSGDLAECECGYVGFVWGTLIGDRVSAPWCPRCQRNSRLRYPKVKGGI